MSRPWAFSSAGAVSWPTRSSAGAAGAAATCWALNLGGRGLLRLLPGLLLCGRLGSRLVDEGLLLGIRRRLLLRGGLGGEALRHGLQVLLAQ